MSKPEKHRRHRPYSLNRCWCKIAKIFGRPTMQERRADAKLAEQREAR